MKKFCLILMCLMLAASCAMAEAPVETAAEAKPTLTASAAIAPEGQTAILSFLFEAEGETVSEAQAVMDAQMDTLRQCLMELGMAHEDLHSRSCDVYPVNEYHYTKISETTLLTGFVVTMELELHMRDERMAGRVIDAVYEMDQECAFDLWYVEDDGAEAKDQALSAAVAEAARKAQVMASAAGLTLDSLVSVTEDAGDRMVQVTYTVKKAEE